MGPADLFPSHGAGKDGPRDLDTGVDHELTPEPSLEGPVAICKGSCALEQGVPRPSGVFYSGSEPIQPASQSGLMEARGEGVLLRIQLTAGLVGTTAADSVPVACRRDVRGRKAGRVRPRDPHTGPANDLANPLPGARRHQGLEDPGPPTPGAEV